MLEVIDRLIADGALDEDRRPVPARAPRAGRLMEDDRVSRFWSAFVAATGTDGDYTAWGFGSDPGMATELGLLVRDGPKRATASLRSAYQDGEPIPRAGELSVILDGDGEPLCVIRTTHVEIRRFADVDEEFAWTEGEGDRSLGVLARGPRQVLHGRRDAARGRHRGRPRAIRPALAAAGRRLTPAPFRHHP